MFGSLLQNGLSRFSHFCVSARRSAPLSRKFRIHPALIGVFFAVHRRNVRWIFIQVWSPNPKFLAVRVDPLPQDFACDPSLLPRLALDAHDIGSKPVAIAAPPAPAMV